MITKMNETHAAIFNEFKYLWEPYYNQPHRKYHTKYHIYRMVYDAESEGQTLTLGQALAVMFHDAFYIPGHEQNEELSIDIMHAALSIHPREISLDEIIIAEECIMSTIKHKPICDEAKLVIDLDLVGLAKRYNEGKWEIQKEFPNLTRGEYLKGRNAFLYHMLRRDIIFHTQDFIKYEKDARLNMKSELNNLYGHMAKKT